MQAHFIASSVGFIIALCLLFYFIAKYRAAEVKDEDEDLYSEPAASTDVSAAAQEVSRLFGRASSAGVGAKEVSDLKDKIKDLHYRVEELRLAEEKRSSELSKLVAQVEQRVSTFENEYVNKLQPTLYSLISELENIQNKAK
jgi:gas vesicle protein